MLQSVKAKVNDMLELEFLLDSGAVASIISLQLIKQLGKEADIHPTNKTLKYAGGDIDILCGLIKLKLKFAADVEIVHTFCVTKNPATPLLLGIDFISGANVLPNPLEQTLTFKGEVEDYIIPTQENSGATIEAEMLDQVLVPVTLTTSKVNKKTKDISIGYDCEFPSGEVQMLWIKLNESTDTWEDDMVLQPKMEIFTKLGIYIVPTILKKEQEGETYCIMMVNMNQHEVTLKKDTTVGQLFQKAVIPEGTSTWTSVEKMLDYLTEEYISQHDEKHAIIPPSILNGPIFEPSKEELEAVGIALITTG